MGYLGMYRQARTAHAQNLTGETFVSLGTSALSARDVCAQGGLLALAVGQIRNHAALCRALGLSYDAQQSAVVMRAYKMWGADYPRRIEGAAVTAVIDRAEDRLLLSRDRMGALPVFYAWRGRSAAFAGHPETLLRAGVAGRVVDREGFCEMIAMGGVHSPGRTPLKDIRRLEPGCVLLADARGTRVKRYFALAPDPEASEADAARETLARAISETAHLSPGVLLSGGRGSARLLAPLCAVLSRPARAFHLNMKAWTGEENAEFAREAAGQFQAAYAEITPSAETVFDALPDAVLARGFPGRAEEDAALLLLARGLTKDCPAALAGTGARMLPGLGAPEARGEILAFPWLENGENGAQEFLKAEVQARVCAREYRRDRLHEALDRVPACPEESFEAANARARTALRLQCELPAECERLYMICERARVSALFPFADERLAAGLLGAPAGDARAEKATPAFIRGRGEGARLIRDEILRVTGDGAQPICEFIDIAKTQAAARDARGDARGLETLLQINDWIMQNEVEVDL